MPSRNGMQTTPFTLPCGRASAQSRQLAAECVDRWPGPTAAFSSAGVFELGIEVKMIKNNTIQTSKPVVVISIVVIHTSCLPTLPPQFPLQRCVACNNSEVRDRYFIRQIRPILPALAFSMPSLSSNAMVNSKSRQICTTCHNQIHLSESHLVDRTLLGRECRDLIW